MNTKRVLSMILILVLIAGLAPHSVHAEKKRTDPGKEGLYVYTDGDKAILDSKIFSKIADVVETARKRIGLSDETTGAEGRFGAALTEEDYAALVPQVIEAVESSDIYVEGSLQQNGVFLLWQTTLGMPCCYSPRMEAQMDGMARGEITVPGQEVLSGMADLLEQQPAAETNGGVHYSTSKELALIFPFWDSSTNNDGASFGTYGKTQDTREQWQALCEEFGSSTNHHYTMGTATVDNIALAIEECAYVAFHSHGDTDYSDGHGDHTSRANCSYICLTATDGINSKDTAVQQGEFGKYFHAVYTTYGAMVSGTCVANHMDKKAPGSYVHLGMCLGMATDGICRPLRDMGVEALLGFSQLVKTSYD